MSRKRSASQEAIVERREERQLKRFWRQMRNLVRPVTDGNTEAEAICDQLIIHHAAIDPKNEFGLEIYVQHLIDLDLTGFSLVGLYALCQSDIGYLMAIIQAVLLQTLPGLNPKGLRMAIRRPESATAFIDRRTICAEASSHIRGFNPAARATAQDDSDE